MTKYEKNDYFILLFLFAKIYILWLHRFFAQKYDLVYNQDVVYRFHSKYGREKYE